MKPLFFLLISLTSYKSYGQSVSEPTRSESGRFSLEISAAYLHPLNARYENKTYIYGTNELESSTKVHFLGSASIAVRTSYRIREWQVAGSQWHFEWSMGLSVRASVLKSDVDAFGSCPRCTFYVSPAQGEFKRTTVNATAFIDNMALFSRKLKTLELSVGVNLRVGYFFYTYSKNVGTRTFLDSGNSETFSESSSEGLDPVRSLTYYYASNYVAEAVVMIRPLMLDGFYFSMHAPLHPFALGKNNKTMYYGVSFGIGFKFKSR